MERPAPPASASLEDICREQFHPLTESTNLRCYEMKPSPTRECFRIDYSQNNGDSKITWAKPVATRSSGLLLGLACNRRWEVQALENLMENIELGSEAPPEGFPRRRCLLAP
jgi:hypothetical protein